jgi:stage V sporulation protein G
MQVTEVRIRKQNPTGKVRAYASVTLDSQFVVHELRVIDGPNGLFVAMPSRKEQSGQFRDIAHPTTQDARKMITGAVLEAYQKAV